MICPRCVKMKIDSVRVEMNYHCPNCWTVFPVEDLAHQGDGLSFLRGERVHLMDMYTGVRADRDRLQDLKDSLDTMGEMYVAEIAELKAKLAEARGLLDDVLGYSLDNTLRNDILAFLAELDEAEMKWGTDDER